jgi:hypothetical protein
MLLNSADLASIHRYCSHHRPLLEESAQAGCFSCGATFAPSEITEWVGDEEAGRDAADTARCPHCGIEAVLPSAAPVMLDARMLSALRQYWFSGPH